MMKPAPEIRWLYNCSILDQLALDQKRERQEWLLDTCLQLVAGAALVGLAVAVWFL